MLAHWAHTHDKQSSYPYSQKLKLATGNRTTVSTGHGQHLSSEAARVYVDVLVGASLDALLEFVQCFEIAEAN